MNHQPQRSQHLFPLRWRVVAALALALATGNQSLPAAEEGKPPAPPSAVLTGRVLDADGHPAPGATVVGERYGGGVHPLGSVVADETGAFRFPGVPADALPAGREVNFHFMARAPGAGVGFAYARQAGEPVELRLSRPVRLTVRFVDATGHPQPGIAVRVAYVIYPTGPGGMDAPPDSPEGRLEARTDGEGRAALPGLPAGCRIRLAVADDRWAAESAVAAGRLFALGDGPEENVEEPVVLVPAGTVSGTVRYEDGGRPVANLGLMLMHVGLGGPDQAVTNEAGHFEFPRVPPGEYQLDAYPADKGDTADWTALRRERVMVAAGQRTEGQDLTLIKGALVTGRATAADTGEGIPGVGIGVTTHGAGWAPTRFANTDAEGRYRLRVPGGRRHVYHAGVAPEGFVAPERASVDVEVADGAEVKVDFVLRRADAGDFITGEVLDPAGRPVTGARVRLVFRYDSLYNAPQETTGADGRFRLPRPRSSQPGDGIVALVRAEVGQLATAEPVVVRGGEPARITLSAAGLATVRGRVTDAAGQPVGGATVQASGNSGDFPENNPHATTDAEGRFHLGELWPGMDYLFSVKAKGHGNELLRGVRLRAGEERELEFDPLAPADRTIAGRVLGSDGRPRPGVRVTARAQDSEAEALTGAEGRFRITGLTDGWVNFDLLVNGSRYPDRLRARTGEEDVVLELPDGNGHSFGDRAPENLGKLLGQTAPLPGAGAAGSWLNLPAGEDVTGLARGKVVVLDFWGLQCGPCLKALPQIEAFWQANRGRGLVVLGVGSQGNPPAEVREWLERHPDSRVTYPLALDPRDRTAALYGVQALPAYAVINRDGRLEYLCHAWEETTRRAEALLEPSAALPLP